MKQSLASRRKADVTRAGRVGSCPRRWSSPIRQAIRIAVWATLAFSPAAGSAQQLHALLIADTSPAAGWGQFAPHVRMDVTHMFGLVLSNVPPDRLAFRILNIEDDATAHPSTILDALAELRPTQEDTLLVYYSGHGAADDRGHYFDLAGGRLYRADLLAAMRSAGPRLAALVSDCCNVRGDGKGFAAAVPDIQEPADYTPIFRGLFIEPAGVVDINACAPGESAFFMPQTDPQREWGSLFTRAFCAHARQDRDRATTWDDFLVGVSLQVNLWFQAGYPGGAKVAKGGAPQRMQNVYAVEYPGMPDRSGPRAGLSVRDSRRETATVVEVRSGFPATRIFDIAAGQYVSLEPGQEIESVNGRRVGTANQFTQAVADSPQVMRLVVRMRDGRRECLMRLRY